MLRDPKKGGTSGICGLWPHRRGSTVIPVEGCPDKSPPGRTLKVSSQMHNLSPLWQVAALELSPESHSYQKLPGSPWLCEPLGADAPPPSPTQAFPFVQPHSAQILATHEPPG